ncbi:MAG: phage Gp37/Gp68 family protein [Deltaproteobacteria bacterium]|nr:phage Gp37/Gp68 family protein [Deltaproteobacteria bacterium]
MSEKTSIEWTDATWNPVRGCAKVSPGCKHCYAETFAERFRGVPGSPYEQGFDLRLVPGLIDLPRQWKRGRRIFVNSMSDLFQDGVPEEYIARVVEVMRETPHHQYQLLTKRSARMADVLGKSGVPDNVWCGVSVETASYVERATDLAQLPARLRFLSIEPLLGPIPDLPLTGIGWVIVGGESGHGARPMDPSWVRAIRDRCLVAGVPFFFKQWGGVNKKKSGRVLDGRTWDEMPGAVGALGTATVSDAAGIGSSSGKVRLRIIVDMQF